jgi:mRNA interferase RelE/StbE
LTRSERRPGSKRKPVAKSGPALAAVEPAARWRLKFVPAALDEWQRLDGSVKEPLRNLLRKRLEQPHVPGAALHGSLQGCYKIKLRQQGYRLVYTVEDDALVVLVLAVDKREDSVAYRAALERLLRTMAAAKGTGTKR